ncbi:hypothetical protein C0991_002980, partial [Blastosporella zonata]
TVMQVDNIVPHQSYFSSPSLNDFSDIFNADLFADDLVNGTLNGTHNSNSPATASSSRGSSPQSPYQSSLMTPPQPAPTHTFPEYDPSSFFTFDDDVQAKHLDPMMSINSAPYDFFGGFGGADIGIDGGIGMDINMNMSTIGTGIVNEVMGIDPQLVGTPAPHSDIEEDQSEHTEDNEQDADVSEPPSPAATTTTTSTKTKARSSKKKEKEAETDEEREKLTLLIQPVKVGGHGKARKGTVQSGGIVKKAPSINPVSAALSKENTYTVSAPFVVPPTFTPTNAYQPTNVYNHNQKKGPGSEGGKDDEDEDDLPQDWRPSPEVFAKMTSKEKRQLRNKISARNFRVRRKEYISTLEGDIAERDRLLDAIRNELGSTQSENLALRQEIAALKRTLLDGRASSTSPDGTTEFPLLNLPPPAPLPAQSAAATLQAQAQAQAQQAQQQQAAALLTPNTQKDASKNGRFWGGVRLGMGMGGVTPVHRVVLPEHTPPSPAPPYSSHTTTPGTPPPPYSSPPASPVLLGKGSVVEKLERERREMQREKERHWEREKETAMYAALASQTLLRKLGGAFWDAFSGSSSSSSSSSLGVASSSSAGRSWDADKVRKVLEGKAVVKVVDIEEPHVKVQQEQIKAPVQQKEAPVAVKHCFASAECLLEQSMRSLTLNKKS